MKLGNSSQIKQTVLQSHSSSEFNFEIAKWWCPLGPNSPIETYTGLAISHRAIRLNPSGDVLLLSKKKALELAHSIIKELEDK